MSDDDKPLVTATSPGSGSVRAWAFSDSAFVTAGDDGQAVLWNGMGQRVASFYLGRDGESMVALPNFYYCGPRSAWNLVAFRLGGNAYPFDAFDLIWNRPDRVLAAIVTCLPVGPARTEAENMIRNYAQAFTQRCLREHVETRGFLGNELPSVDFVGAKP